MLSVFSLALAVTVQDFISSEVWDRGHDPDPKNTHTGAPDKTKPPDRCLSHNTRPREGDGGGGIRCGWGQMLVVHSLSGLFVPGGPAEPANRVAEICFTPTYPVSLTTNIYHQREQNAKHLA